MSEGDHGGPWTRTERAAFAAFAALLVASLPLLVHPWFDATPDAATYLATARSLAAGEGYHYLGEPFRVRPPGFSLLIAPLVAGGFDFGALNLLVSLFGAAGVLLLALFLRPRLGAALALLVGLCVWLSPAYQTLCNQVMSDVPGATLVLGCLLLERRVEARSGLWRWALLGAAVGTAAYLRANAILLVPAMAAAHLARSLRRPAPEGPARLRPALRELAAFAAAATLVALPWALRNAQLPDAPASFTRIHSYPVASWRADPADPGSRRLSAAELLGRAPRRAEQIVSALGSRLQARERGDRPLGEPIGAGQVGFALALLAGIGAQLWRRRESAEIFVALNLAVVLLYFGFSWRLLLPVHLIGLGAAVELLRQLAGRLVSGRTAALGAAALPLGLLLLDLPPRRGWEGLRADHGRLQALAAAVEREIPPHEVLAASQVAFGAFLDRPVYNLQPLLHRGGAGAELEAFFDRHAIQRVLVPEGDLRAEPAVAQLRARYGPPTRIGAGRSWAVR